MFFISSYIEEHELNLRFQLSDHFNVLSIILFALPSAGIGADRQHVSDR